MWTLFARRCGFTLLEILVAVTILAVALVALMRAFATGLMGIGLAEARVIAVAHARAKLEEVGSVIALEPGELDGEWDDGYRWHVSIDPYELELGEAGAGAALAPYTVEVTVSWDDARDVTLTTLRLGPAQ